MVKLLKGKKTASKQNVKTAKNIVICSGVTYSPVFVLVLAKVFLYKQKPGLLR